MRRGARPSDVEIANALEAVKKDPNLDTEVKVKTLRWIGTRKPQPSLRSGRCSSGCANSVRWFERSARVLMWAAVAILAVWLATFIIRLVSRRAPRQRSDDGFVAPTHVRDLDIRPEALPPNIGAAARALWDRGKHRAALALLYRGLLSRLVHAYRVPIRDSSTEGDCLELAADHLAEAVAARLCVATRSGSGSARCMAARIRRPRRSTTCATRSRRALDRAAASSAAVVPRSGGGRPHDHDAPRLIVLSIIGIVLLYGVGNVDRASHRVGRTYAADAAERRGGAQSVLCRAAFRGSARRDDDLGSHLRGAVGRMR